jgi:hypothetical protein
MGNTSTSTASGHCARVSACPPVRSYLTAAGAIAIAGILALSFVAPPPDSHGARTEVHPVPLAAFWMPLAPPPVGLPEELISNQAQTLAPVAALVPGAADITNAVVTAPLTLESVIDPAINSQQVNSAALALTTTAVDPFTEFWNQNILPIVGPIILFGTIAFGFLVVLPVEWFIQTAYDFIRSLFGLPPDPLPLPGTTPGTANAIAASAPELSDSQLSDTAPITLAKAGPADDAPANEPGKADDSPPVTPTDRPTHSEQVTSTKPTTGNEQVSTKPATSKKDMTESTEPAKPAERPATPRPVVRGSLRQDDLLSNVPHRGNGGRSTTRTASASEATGGLSSVASSPAASSPAGSDSSGDDSSGGDADDS